jgi:hypothetical protein
MAIARINVDPWVSDVSRRTGREDGNGKAVFTKAIEFTDFPVERVTLWFENNTIYLPSEH